MNDVKSQTRSLFACISDENGMWMYAGLHRDLADAVIGYAKEASMPIGTHYQSDGFTWYKFNLPPENWEDWNGEMDPADYDALDAADHKHQDANRAVSQARARLERMRDESNVTSLKPKEPTSADLREIVMTLQNREPGAEKISVGASNFAANGCAIFRVEMWGYDSWKELKAGEFVDHENGLTVSFETVGRSEKWEIEAFIEVTLNWAGHSWPNAFMQAWGDSNAWKDKRQFLVAQYRKENE